MVRGLQDLSLLKYNQLPEYVKDTISLEENEKNRAKALSKFGKETTSFIEKIAQEHPDCDFLLHRTYEQPNTPAMDDIMAGGLGINTGDIEFTTTICGSNPEDLLCQASSTPGFKGYSTAIIALVPRNGIDYMPGKTVPILYETDSSAISTGTTAITSENTGKGYKLLPQYMVGFISDIVPNENIPDSSFVTQEDYLNQRNLIMRTPDSSLTRYNNNTSLDDKQRLDKEYGKNIPWSTSLIKKCNYNDDELSYIYPDGISDENGKVISINEEQNKLFGPKTSLQKNNSESIFKLIGNVTKSALDNVQKWFSRTFDKDRSDIDGR